MRGACRVSLAGAAPQRLQSQQGWAGAVVGSAQAVQLPGWSTSTGLPMDELRGPTCRSVPLAQDMQLKASPNGKGWPWLQPLCKSRSKENDIVSTLLTETWRWNVLLMDTETLKENCMV